MRTETSNIYRFWELSEAAQRRAWENGPDFSDIDDDERRATLAVFEQTFDIKVYHWEVGAYRAPNWRFVSAGRATEAPAGDWLRLAKYLWNNYAAEIETGRYYSARGRMENGEYKCKSRRSKIMIEMDNCPLTGCVTDCDILRPILDCLKYKNKYDSFDDLIDDCLHSFFNAWDADIEYFRSFEYFAEAMEIYDYEFTETGDIYP